MQLRHYKNMKKLNSKQSFESYMGLNNHKGDQSMQPMYPCVLKLHEKAE